jgi:hypothetical protein
MKTMTLLMPAFFALTGCVHGPDPVMVPNEKAVARIEFDGSGDVYWRSNRSVQGFSDVEATLRGRDLYVQAVDGSGTLRKLHRLLDVYPSAQFRGYLAVNYQEFGGNTRWAEVLVDGSELDLTEHGGNRDLISRPHSPLGHYFLAQVQAVLADHPQPGTKYEEGSLLWNM